MVVLLDASVLAVADVCMGALGSVGASPSVGTPPFFTSDSSSDITTVTGESECG